MLFLLLLGLFVVGYMNPNAHTNTMSLFLSNTRNSPPPPTVKHIPQTLPILTIHGLNDEVVPVTDAALIASLIPNHTLRLIPNANHNFSSKHENDGAVTASSQLVDRVLEWLEEERIGMRRFWIAWGRLPYHCYGGVGGATGSRLGNCVVEDTNRVKKVDGIKKLSEVSVIKIHSSYINQL